MKSNISFHACFSRFLENLVLLPVSHSALSLEFQGLCSCLLRFFVASPWARNRAETVFLSSANTSSDPNNARRRADSPLFRFFFSFKHIWKLCRHCHCDLSLPSSSLSPSRFRFSVLPKCGRPAFASLLLSDRSAMLSGGVVKYFLKKSVIILMLFRQKWIRNRIRSSTSLIVYQQLSTVIILPIFFRLQW